MATIDKKSVRNEFDNIKNEFNNLSANKKISPECKALFNSLILLFELILSIIVLSTSSEPFPLPIDMFFDIINYGSLRLLWLRLILL